MHDRMKRALFAMYDLMDEAGERQEERGGHDQGERTKVTAGQHLNKVVEVIVDDLVADGYLDSDIVRGGMKPTIPGWFRATKTWDLLAFAGDDLMCAVELKSINSSFSNNVNNRAEEAIGEAVDADYAIRKELIRYQARPPVLGYALVVKDCEKSRKRARNMQATSPTDSVFEDTSYLERFSIMCRRLLAERIYQAVWLVYVDPDNQAITEPDPELRYEMFIEALKAQRRIASA